MSITETLALVNEHRVQQGMKPLKSWKDSKAKLDAMLAKLEDAAVNETDMPAPVVTRGETKVAEGAYKNEREAKERTGMGTQGKPKKSAITQKPAKAAITRDNAEPKAKRSAATPTGSPSSEASKAAQQLGMNPKNVRARLRKLGHNAGHGLSAAEIVKLLSK